MTVSGPAGIPRRIGVVHLGRFSGTTPALVASLRGAGIEVQAFDFSRLGRRPRSLAGRTSASVRAAGHAYPWPRTPQWADVVRREVGRLPVMPLVFMQTVLACAVDPARPYVVFTDRVAGERPAAATQWETSSHPAWLEGEAAFLAAARHVFVMGPTSAVALAEIGVTDVTVVGSGSTCALPELRDRSAERPERLLFLGKDWNRKGGPELLDALARLERDTSHRVHLDVVGCRPDVVGRDVTVHGPVRAPLLAPFLDDAHALVLPTRSEAFGIAFVEAISSGLPVLGSDVGNVPWIIGDAGVAADPRSPAAMAASLADLLDGYPTFARRAAARGAEFRTTWTWDRIAGQLLGALDVPTDAPAAQPEHAAPTVHAVVVTHSRHDVLVETLATVLDQTRPPDSIVVVDNASTDATVDRLRDAFPTIEVLAMTENLGPAGGIAAGMQRVLGRGADVIWLVEDDTLYERDLVERGLELLDAHPELSMVGPRGWEFDGVIWRGCAQPMTSPRFGALPTLDGALVRRQVALEVGVPATDWFMMIQDVEYPLRILEAGHVTAVHPGMRTNARGVGAAAGDARPFRAYYQSRNHLRLALDRTSPRLLYGFVRRSLGLILSDLRADHPTRSLAMRSVGVVDACRGRMGRTIEPGQQWPTFR